MTGDLLERGKSSFNLAKMVVWVPSGKAHLQEVGVHATEDQKQIQTSNTSINHPRSVQMKFYSCLYSL